MRRKDEVMQFAENLFGTMNISEEQRVIFNAMFNQTMDEMSDNDFEKMENEIVKFVERPKVKNAFD